MKKVEKLRETILHLLDVQIEKIKKAEKAHQIVAVVDWLDQELFDKVNFILFQQQGNQYFESNKQVDNWFDQEEEIKETKKKTKEKAKGE